MSKGNYNVARIEYLAKLFPDARFVVPVREPVAHVASLVRQHQLFNGYAQDDPRIGIYLSAAGHFEFGPQRRPICLTPEAAEGASGVWDEGDAAGYARQWAEVYGHVARLKASPWSRYWSTTGNSMARAERLPCWLPSSTKMRVGTSGGALKGISISTRPLVPRIWTR